MREETEVIAVKKDIRSESRGGEGEMQSRHPCRDGRGTTHSHARWAPHMRGCWVCRQCFRWTSVERRYGRVVRSWVAVDGGEGMGVENQAVRGEGNGVLRAEAGGHSALRSRWERPMVRPKRSPPNQCPPVSPGYRQTPAQGPLTQKCSLARIHAAFLYEQRPLSTLKQKEYLVLF